MSTFNCPLHGLSSGTYCPRCNSWPHPGYYQAPQMGCICPPTSEQTCQAPMCPRKPFKPCKTIRRVLLAVWGRNAADYTGRSMTLYRDDSVTFGGLNVGGIRVSHMSHLDKETVVVVVKTKGKKAGIKVQPLKADQQPAASTEDAAEKWANGYIGKIKTLTTAADLKSFSDQKAAKLAELATARPELHELVTSALVKRETELQASADPFAAEEDNFA